MADHRISLNKLLKTEIIQSIFCNYIGKKLAIYRWKVRKLANIWKLNNTVLNNQWVKEEITRENRKYLKTNENGNTINQNMLCSKAVLRRKFTIVNVHIKKEERSQINNLTLHHKELEKEQTKPKDSMKKEIIKSRVEINKIENRKKQQRKATKPKTVFLRDL